MDEYQEHQTCPYCGHQVDDHLANWDNDPEIVTCGSCEQIYETIVKYKFLGFDNRKLCKECLETEEFCCCTEF